jgi:hypothetical protein
LGQRTKNRCAAALDIQFKDSNAPSRQGKIQPFVRHQETLLAAHHFARRFRPHSGHLDVGGNARQQFARRKRLY